jgi:hypothetical protein
MPLQLASCAQCGHTRHLRQPTLQLQQQQQQQQQQSLRTRKPCCKEQQRVAIITMQARQSPNETGLRAAQHRPRSMLPALPPQQPHHHSICSQAPGSMLQLPWWAEQHAGRWATGRPGGSAVLADTSLVNHLQCRHSPAGRLGSIAGAAAAEACLHTLMPPLQMTCRNTGRRPRQPGAQLHALHACSQAPEQPSTSPTASLEAALQHARPTSFNCAECAMH